MAKVMKDSAIEWIGVIPQEWNVSKLKYIKDKKEYSIVDGPFGSAISTEDYVDEGIPLVRITNLSGDYVSFSNMVYINESLADSLRRSSFTVGDIIFAKTGATVGKCAINSSIEYGILASSCIKISVGSQFITKYYFYVFNTNEFVQALINACNGTTRDTINLTPFNNLYCTIPPIQTQQRIVDYLDEKCKEINSIIENTKATIEEYKKYKQTLIIEAITKGLEPNVEMVDSKIEWVGHIPKHWRIYTLNQIFNQVKCKNSSMQETNLLSLSYGKIIQKDINTNGGLLPENFEGYNIVENGDIVLRLTDLQNDHTSLRVGLATQKGIITSAYITIRNQSENNSEYLYYYLHSFDIYKGFYGMGSGVRQGLTFDGIKYLKVALPTKQEQDEVVEYLKSIEEQINNLISQKQQFITEIESYKKSLIYECVTGKRSIEVSENIQKTMIIYPLFPALLTTDKKRFAQAVLASKVIETANTSQFGRVKLEKILYTIETHIGFDFDTDYKRQVAGPLDGSVYQCENMISQRNKWFNINGNKNAVKYSPGKDMANYKNYYNKYFTAYNQEIERIINIFRPLSTNQAEIIATLYASWNDFIISGKAFTDNDIVNDVLNNWHDSKKRFSKDIWLSAIEQMRKLDLVPKGYGKKTSMA